MRSAPSQQLDQMRSLCSALHPNLIFQATRSVRQSSLNKQQCKKIRRRTEGKEAYCTGRRVESARSL